MPKVNIQVNLSPLKVGFLSWMSCILVGESRCWFVQDQIFCKLSSEFKIFLGSRIKLVIQQTLLKKLGIETG